MDKRKKNKFDNIDSNKDGIISEEEFEKAADEISDSGEEGIRKEELNWFMRMITLGDRFDPRDFYDRLKKSTVEFVVIFSGILLSFYVEQSWTVSEGRADRIQNLESLTAEVSEMITYTEGRIEEMKWVSETFKKQYERWDDDDPLVFYKRIINIATESLYSEGRLFFEINENFSNELINILGQTGFVDIELKKDINERPRMIKAIWK